MYKRTLPVYYTLVTGFSSHYLDHKKIFLPLAIVRSGPVEISKMASLCRQIIRGNAIRGVLMNAARRGYADKMMPDPLEHATGLEKKELLAIQSGDDDPFNMKVLKKSAGTRDKPTLVPSCFDARIVGCICEEHSTAISWLWIHKGQPRRCECGHWYKLIEKTPL